MLIALTALSASRTSFNRCDKWQMSLLNGKGTLFTTPSGGMKSHIILSTPKRINHKTSGAFCNHRHASQSTIRITQKREMDMTVKTIGAK